MTQEKQRQGFELAAGLLPQRLQAAARSLSVQEQVQCEEFRLRAGQPFCATVAGRMVPLPAGGPALTVQGQDLTELVAQCTSHSVHTYAQQIAGGYVPLPGGCRLGLCGEGVLDDKGSIRMFRTFTAANLRIARPIEGPMGRHSDPFASRRGQDHIAAGPGACALPRARCGFAG